jgi:hypothetical protein
MDFIMLMAGEEQSKLEIMERIKIKTEKYELRL